MILGLVEIFDTPFCESYQLIIGDKRIDIYIGIDRFRDGYMGVMCSSNEFCFGEFEGKDIHSVKVQCMEHMTNIIKKAKELNKLTSGDLVKYLLEELK